MNLIETKYKIQAPIIGIKEKLKTYHIAANVEQRLVFKNMYKPEGYKRSELNQPHLQDKVNLIKETEIIKAKNMEEAQKKVAQNIFQKFGDMKEFNKNDKKSGSNSDDYYDTHVDKIDFIDSYEESESSNQEPSTMFLKSASPIEYNFTTHEKKFLQNNGHCVEDNLIGIYGNLIKKFTLKNIIEIASEFYKNKNISWTNSMGYSSDCIIHICEKFHISAYAFDIMNTCFKKTISSRNYPALFFYAMNNHMYLVKDIDLCKSLCEIAKDNKISYNTSLIEDIQTKNIYDELPIHENLDISNMKGYDSCIIIYSRESYTNINDIFLQCLSLYGIPINKTIKAEKSNIKKFEYKINKKHYYIVIDPNDLSIINWKKIKAMCEKHEVPFRNQTFLSFIKEVRTNLINKKSERHLFTNEERYNIFNTSSKKCRICEESIKSKHYEIDHIKALKNGGTNDINNLQLLCKSCHKEKTLREKEDGSYIKIIETESSFNNQVNEIMSSELSERYAFIEHRESLDDNKQEIKINKKYSDEDFQRKEAILLRNDKPWYAEQEGDFLEFFNYWKSLKTETITKIEPKIHNIDIKKCRKNNLYYSKYDLPVFTVMDKVEIFNNEIPLKTGIYYVETKAYFPMRGNGWYSLPMIDYCLQNNIIKLDNIKYCVQCLVSIPANYYNEFIDYCYEKLDEDYKKLSINMMIGGFKPNLNKHQNWLSVCITSNSCEAYHQYIKNNGCFIEIIKVNDIKYFHVYKEILKTNCETEKPIYDQIMDLEAIALHKLSKLIESKNGKVLDLNTDCVTCIFENNIFPFDLDDNKDIKGYYYDDENEVPLYKLEEKITRLQIEKKPKYKRDIKYDYQVLTWNNFDDVQDNNFKPLVETVINKINPFL